MTKHSIVSIAKADMLAAPDSSALMISDREEGYFFLGKGKIWNVGKSGVTSIFEESHNERYFYKVRQDRLQAFNELLFQHLPKEVFVYASTLRGECLELENGEIMLAITQEMARQNESDAGERKYIT